MWGLLLMFFNSKMKMSNQKGVTLLEILLVLVISSIIMVMIIGFLQQQTDEMRRSRVTNQIIQILNAGLAYYVANNAWPQTIDDLVTGGYLPASSGCYPTNIFSCNPWGSPFITLNYTTMLYVTTNVSTPQDASSIAGRVPFGFVADSSSGVYGPTPPTPGQCTTLKPPCKYVVASVNIPAQQLNNAATLSFASIYHSGACVPAPVCPQDKNGKTMTPQIFVIPLSVSGVYDDPTAIKNNCKDPADFTTCFNINAFPLTSYTAFAIGKSSTDGSPVPYTKGITTISNCDGSTPANICLNTSSTDEINTSGISYWRVCLSVSTEKGLIKPIGTNWAQGQAIGTVLAVTRCMPANEDVGAKFEVWQN